MAPHKSLRTYSRDRSRNVSCVEALNILFAKNLTARKLGNKVQKGKNHLLIKELPKKIKTVLSDDSSLHVNFNDTFDKLLKKPEHNKLNSREFSIKIIAKSTSNTVIQHERFNSFSPMQSKLRSYSSKSKAEITDLTNTYSWFKHPSLSKERITNELEIEVVGNKETKENKRSKHIFKANSSRGSPIWLRSSSKLPDINVTDTSSIKEKSKNIGKEVKKKEKIKELPSKTTEISMNSTSSFNTIFTNSLREKIVLHCSTPLKLNQGTKQLINHPISPIRNFEDEVKSCILESLEEIRNWDTSLNTESKSTTNGSQNKTNKSRSRMGHKSFTSLDQLRKEERNISKKSYTKSIDVSDKCFTLDDFELFYSKMSQKDSRKFMSVSLIDFENFHSQYISSLDAKSLLKNNDNNFITVRRPRQSPRCTSLHTKFSSLNEKFDIKSLVVVLDKMLLNSTTPISQKKVLSQISMLDSMTKKHPELARVSLESCRRFEANDQLNFKACRKYSSNWVPGKLLDSQTSSSNSRDVDNLSYSDIFGLRQLFVHLPKSSFRDIKPNIKITEVSSISSSTRKTDSKKKKERQEQEELEKDHKICQRKISFNENSQKSMRILRSSSSPICTNKEQRSLDSTNGKNRAKDISIDVDRRGRKLSSKIQRTNKDIPISSTSRAKSFKTSPSSTEDDYRARISYNSIIKQDLVLEKVAINVPQIVEKKNNYYEVKTSFNTSKCSSTDSYNFYDLSDKILQKNKTENDTLPVIPIFKDIVDTLELNNVSASNENIVVKTPIMKDMVVNLTHNDFNIRFATGVIPEGENISSKRFKPDYNFYDLSDTFLQNTENSPQRETTITRGVIDLTRDDNRISITSTIQHTFTKNNNDTSTNTPITEGEATDLDSNTSHICADAVDQFHEEDDEHSNIPAVEYDTPQNFPIMKNTTIDLSKCLETPQSAINSPRNSNTSNRPTSKYRTREKSRTEVKSTERYSAVDKEQLSPIYVDDSDPDIVNTSLSSSESFRFQIPLFFNKQKKKSLYVAPGKLWRRSLLTQQRESVIDATRSSLNKPEPSTIPFPQIPLRPQNISAARESIRIVPITNRVSRRNTILQNYAHTYTGERINENLGEIIGVSTPIKPKVSLPKQVPIITAKEIILQRCQQTEPLPFRKFCTDSMLQNCKKIGEGVYGEVFLYSKPDGSTTVMKIIPIEGEKIINEEKQKRFHEVLSEVIITSELSNLRKNSVNRTCTFSEMQKISCVKGKYPKGLVDLWHVYDNIKVSENDSPEIFDDSQLYIVLALANAGQDLESFVFNNATQATSMFKQVAFALAIAEQHLFFEHRDLHWGNVLLKQVDKNKKVTYNYKGKEIVTHTNGIEATIIDFTLSRIEYDGVIIFNNLGQDPDLFIAEGDYQFEIYRLMRKHNGNDWKSFVPFTNLLWLHYIVRKSITALRYKNTKTKIHKNGINHLQDIEKVILDFKSASDFVSSYYEL